MERRPNAISGSNGSCPAESTTDSMDIRKNRKKGGCFFCEKKSCKVLYAFFFVCVCVLLVFFGGVGLLLVYNGSIIVDPGRSTMFNMKAC